MKNKGMTLVELIVASTLMLILASLMVKGVLFGWKILEVDKNFAEAAILSNSLIAKLQDELNYAEIEQIESDRIIYLDDRGQSELFNQDGRIKYEISGVTYDLIPSAAYGHLSGIFENTEVVPVITSSGTRQEIKFNLKITDAANRELRDIDFWIYPLNK